MVQHAAGKGCPPLALDLCRLRDCCSGGRGNKCKSEMLVDRPSIWRMKYGDLVDFSHDVLLPLEPMMLGPRRRPGAEPLRLPFGVVKESSVGGVKS
ncbi:hypothetical protein TNCV_2700401 [Trichonephila clavipes]|nr:hypothetical protein TNCV_2700401 [Trichonephila clavipes]